MAAKNYSNIAVETTLASGIAAGALSLVVASASGWPATPFTLVIDPDTASEELILVSGKAGTTFSSLTRGYGGTSDVDHNAGAVIKHAIPAEDHRLIWEHNHGGAGGDDTAIVSHDALSGVSADDHHAQAHTVSSHSDTAATGAELNTLTDGSDADALHTHPAHAAAADPHPGYVLNAELASHEADEVAHFDGPRGLLAGPVTGSNAGVAGTLTDLAGASLTVIIPAGGRTIKVCAEGNILVKAVPGAGDYEGGHTGYIMEGAATLSTFINCFGKRANDHFGGHGEAVIVATEGSHTYKLASQRFTGIGEHNLVAEMWIEDLGPA